MRRRRLAVVVLHVVLVMWIATLPAMAVWAQTADDEPETSDASAEHVHRGVPVGELVGVENRVGFFRLNRLMDEGGISRRSRSHRGSESSSPPSGESKPPKHR